LATVVGNVRKNPLSVLRHQAASANIEPVMGWRKIFLNKWTLLILSITLLLSILIYKDFEPPLTMESEPTGITTELSSILLDSYLRAG